MRIRHCRRRPEKATSIVPSFGNAPSENQARRLSSATMPGTRSGPGAFQSHQASPTLYLMAAPPPAERPIRVALESIRLLFRRSGNALLALDKRLLIGTTAGTRIGKLDSIILPSAHRTNLIRTVEIFAYSAKAAAWTREGHLFAERKK